MRKKRSNHETLERAEAFGLLLSAYHSSRQHQDPTLLIPTSFLCMHCEHYRLENTPSLIKKSSIALTS